MLEPLFEELLVVALALTCERLHNLFGASAQVHNKVDPNTEIGRLETYSV